MAAPKIIVFGSLRGQFETAIKKLTTLHAKNAFSLAILTGDIFTPEGDDDLVTSLLNGAIEIPLPTYFTVGSHTLPERIAAKVAADEDVCPNLHFLGKRSITKTIDGIRIVNLGGILDTNIIGGQSKDQHMPLHTPDDAKGLKGANSADILLTSMWPSGVWKGSKVNLEPAQQAAIASSQSIAELCATLKPRYHITSSPQDFFYEREAFLQPAEEGSEGRKATRFISMAPYGNVAKAKAMYAFALNSSDNSIPAGSTASPFTSGQKRPRNEEQHSRFSNSQHDGNHHGRRTKRRHASPPPGPDRCYFCLSNPNLSAHMCCSIGEEAYITTAKGPLPTSTTFHKEGLNFPGHFIIIPLPHAPTIASMGGTEDSSSEATRTYTEMNRFKESIQAMIASKSSHKLGAVTWEISRHRNVHLIWQLIAIPADLIQKGIAEAAFRVEAENHDLPVFATKDLSLEEQASYGDFFRVWLWADNGEDKLKGKCLVMPLNPDTRFDLQFGRRVLAKLMNLEKRIQWKECEQTVEEETQDVERFRAAFKEWDFTLE